MALRVLLADESPTIKRVIQLSLADYGVEVKTVANGLDVLSITESFQPDIVFIDILLTKKDGYTVCQELKKHTGTQTIPVVLMWSSFMEVDDAKVRNCLSDARLEKPFDADQLRTLVQDLVPSTTSNPVSSFLQFPDMPDFEESPRIPQSAPGTDEIFAESSDSIEMPTMDFGSDEGPEEFQPVPLTPTKGPSPFVELEAPNADGFFSSPLPTEEFEEISFVKSKEISPEFMEATVIPEPRVIPSQRQPAKSAGDGSTHSGISQSPIHHVTTAPQVQVSAAMIEKVVREEVQKQIEDICWKIIPDIAERVIREEIHKMIQETERSL